ncbi:MAG: hypothetical protein DMD91_03490 [Candidatus Rokuibacteriota bacterium]|nr:MAG: hypothetical protein DMD91_03490 [Candidatus Rokubacteria bacterium]
MAARDQVTRGSLLDRLAHDGRGGFRRGDERFLLIRPETLVGVQHAVERVLGARAAECFVEGGRTGGARALRSFTGSAEERARALTAMAADLGWGTLTLETLTSTSFVVAGSNSPFPGAHAATGDPVCHLTRGVLEALAENLFGSGARVIETHCEAIGAPSCRFEAVVDASSGPARAGGAVDASSGPARIGGEMGGTSRPPHSP